MTSTDSFKLVACFCVLAVTLLMHSAPSATASAACGGWSLVSSPNNGPENQLDGVAAVSATNLWAVGFDGNQLGGPHQTLTEHFR
jgi:hypothetical protein